ncbi:hypothetical protein NSU18_23685 [Paenibacillus sp. FSL H8-0048]
MNRIESLNRQIEMSSEEFEDMIAELVEREECACTLDGCGAKACGVN